ncbi:rhomboid family intramembrane serine protease [Virgibacillus ainsalahensis]
MFIRNERSIKEFIQFYPVVAGIAIINAALWLIIDFLQLPFGQMIYQWGTGSNYFIAHGEYWRLVTPIFLHGGFMHLLFNTFALVIFGPALEQMLGKAKFLLAYFGAGIAGNIATYVFGPSEFFYVHLGASGAIYGLFGIYLFMVAFRKHLIDPGSTQIIVVLFVIGLILTFVRSNINTHAHVFGFLGGFVIAPLILSNVKPYSPWRNRRHFHKENDDSIQFDPNRWKKRGISQKMKKNIWWIILGILVLIAIWNRL